MINRPERSDTDFTWDDFQKKNNAEIVGNFGNLVNRTMVFLNKSFNSEIPEGELDENDKKILEEIKKSSKNVEEALDTVSIKEALKQIMHISRIANQYLQENEPWKNPDPKRKAACLYVLANIVKDLSIMIEPYMPLAAASIRKQLHIHQKPSWSDIGVMSIKPGHKIGNAELLFKKIEDADLKAFREQFAGKKKVENVITKNSFDRLQLRVAKITKVEKHPKAEKLYIEHIDFGDEQRVIVSGLVPYYSADALIGRKIIVVTNLEPASLRGVESNGMLLAAQEKEIVGLLETDAEIGEYVYIDESKIEGIKNLPRITIQDFSEAKLMARDGKVYFNDKELKVKGSGITVDKVKNGPVR
jgi:methionyl-tRNA synthetase